MPTLGPPKHNETMNNPFDDVAKVSTIRGFGEDVKIKLD